MPPVEIRGERTPVFGTGALDKPASNQVGTGGRTRRAQLVRAVVAPAVLASGTALLYFTRLAGRLPAGGERWVLWLFVAAGIWGACAQPVSVRNRQSSISIVLTEIPALVGIVFLVPWLLLSAIAVGHLAGSLQRRLPLLKAITSLVLYAASAAVGIVFYDWAIGYSSPISPRGWVVTIGTITLINLVDLVLLLALMAVVNPNWRRPPMRAMVLQGAVHVGVCSAGALVAISLIWVNTWGAVLFIAIAAAANYAYRGTILSGQRYANLEKLYEFTRRLGSLVEAPDVMGTVLEEARNLLSAGYAELVIPLEEPSTGFALRCALSGEGAPHLDERSPFSPLDRIVCERGALLASDGSKQEEALATAVAQRGLKEVLVAPLQRDDTGTGYLLVADRAFKHEGFKRADLRFFEALAANAGVALRSSKLLEQLRREASVRQFQAQHDALTALPNRALFAERLEEATAGALPGSRVTVMLIDLDGFKEVNDTLGHHTGDAILREVAQRLAPLDQEGNLVARLGGDEFAVLHVGDPRRLRHFREGRTDSGHHLPATWGRGPPAGCAGQPRRRGFPAQQPRRHRVVAPRRHCHVRSEGVGRRRTVLRPGRGPLHLAPAQTGHRAAPGDRTGRPRRLVPAGGAARDGRRGQLRGLVALEPRPVRADFPDRVHPRGRERRADRPAHVVGHRNGPGPGQKLAPNNPRPQRSGQPFRPEPHEHGRIDPPGRRAPTGRPGAERLDPRVD